MNFAVSVNVPKSVSSISMLQCRAIQSGLGRHPVQIAADDAAVKTSMPRLPLEERDDEVAVHVLHREV